MPEEKAPNIPPNAADADSFLGIFGSGVEQTIEQTQGNTQSGSSESATGSENPDSADNNEAGVQPDPEQFASSNEPETGDEAGGEQEAAEAVDPDDPKNDPKRVEYWQSRADKNEAELNKFKSQVESQMPLMKYINENPDLAQEVYSDIQKHLSSDKGSSQDAQEQTFDMPERPQKPQKPTNYDPVDAINARDSESFKYRQEMEEYQEELTAYNEALVESQSARQQKEQQAKKQQTQKQQQARELYNEAMYRYQMKPEQASEFVQWTFSPDYSMEDLVAVFNHRKNMQGKQSKKANNQSNSNKPPAPPSKNGSAVKREVSEVNVDDPEEMGSEFTDSLFSFAGQ